MVKNMVGVIASGTIGEYLDPCRVLIILRQPAIEQAALEIVNVFNINAQICPRQNDNKI